MSSDNEDNNNDNTSTPPNEQQQNNNNTEKEFDITTACWFYLDNDGVKQGPFSFKDMYSWYKGGFFAKDLQIKTVWDNAFRALASIPSE
jgi:hypothetical protein